MEKYIGLARVSTEKQGTSRLGLEAGLTDIRSFVESRSGLLINVVEEVESGTKATLMNRPSLLEAIDLCKFHNATLVIPKLDRLTRSTDCLTDIRREQVKFIAVDMPNADDFTINIMVAVAAKEAKDCSTRTKNAAREYKAQKKLPKKITKMYPDGVPEEVAEKYAGKLGCAYPGRTIKDGIWTKGGESTAIKRSQEAMRAYKLILPQMLTWQSEGCSNVEIARRLNEAGYTTRGQGKPWNKMTVRKVLMRAAQ